MGRHVNIPVFIPHLGCPNQCVFCNQRSISGKLQFAEESVRGEIEEVIATVSKDDECEIAFFGGSFTGIDRELMIRLLKLGKEYMDTGAVKSLRCSTRPDYIDGQILDILKSYGVKTVELGLQSCSDSVLAVSRRGHSELDAMRACSLIKERGFTLVGQMMIGLPASSAEDELSTAKKIVEWGCDEARIYPTVVFKDTELADMTQRGEYTPLSLDEAVERSALVLDYFLNNSVKVIRIGLCSSENLASDTTYLAGPNHPALGELTQGMVYYHRIRNKLSASERVSERICITVPTGEMSKAVGQKKCYKERLIKEFGFQQIIYREDSSLMEYSISFAYI